MRHRFKTIAVAAIASALTATGIAIAHGDGWKGDRGFELAPGGKSLTWSETHLRHRGEDVTLRADQGKVVAASDTAISIARNDGETVEVPVDENTKVWGGWWRGHGAKASHHRRDRFAVADIPAGKRVIVFRTDDDPAAEAVSVNRHHRHR